MRAVVLGDDGLRLDAAYPEPNRRKGEAIVRVSRAGICGTDLEIVKGYKGFRGVLGHAFVGTVETAGRGSPPEGTRVVAEINVGCGKCERCQRGGWRHCPGRSVLGILGRDGGFAERVAVPGRNLVEVPDGVPDELAALTEPLAAALRIFEQTQIRRDTSVVVLGPGRLGRLVALAMERRSEHVQLVGRGDRVTEQAEVVIDATGSADGFARALDVVCPLGTVILKSTCAGDVTIPASLLTKAVVNETRILGSRCGWRDHFEQARLMLMMDGKDFEPLIEATYPLEQFARAFEHAARPGALHVLLDLA